MLFKIHPKNLVISVILEELKMLLGSIFGGNTAAP